VNLRRHFVTGLLIWVPLAVTLWVLDILIGWLDQSAALLPANWRTEAWLGTHVPGLGVLVTLLIVFLTGVLATNIIGQRLVVFWERLLRRIPVVRSIYYGAKQVSDSLLSGSNQAFRKVVMVQFPAPGTWTLGFLTGRPAGEVAAHLPGEHVSIFIPLTPNPTAGYFLLLPVESVIELDMSVEDGLKYIISMGMVAPPGRAPRVSVPASAAAQPAAVRH
jgi:uncharacterized membrane protein